MVFQHVSGIRTVLYVLYCSFLHIRLYLDISSEYFNPFFRFLQISVVFYYICFFSVNIDDSFLF